MELHGSEANFHNSVEAVFLSLMKDRGTPVADVDAARTLYDEGYGLDSMDTATLSAMLNEQFGDDPYSSGVYPRNIAEIVAYYRNRAAT